MKIPRPRFNIIELTLFALLLMFLAFSTGRYHEAKAMQPFLSRGNTELQRYSERFGPQRNSRYGEEWLIRDYFNDERDGVFVDVGANHYRRESNTYYLESALGWSGIAIEPQIKFAGDYGKYRPRTKFIPLFVSDASNATATLYVPDNDLVASATREFAEEVSETRAVSVDTTTLDDILDRSGITRIDFMSIDIELHEPQALKGFSIERFKPRLVCVEGHLPVRQQILDYFTSHGYSVVGRYLRADSENLWFAPQTGS